MVYISKTLIPGKTPIGSATGGGYMYDDKDKPASLFSPTQNMSVPGQNMSIPKKVTPIPMPYGVQTGVPGLGSTPITPFAPSVGFSPERAKQINQPVKDTLNFRTKIVEDSPRVQQLRKHFRALEQKGEFQLNEKQTEYIRKFKAKYPDYENVPDVSLYSKIILAEPKAQEQYGNIGEKGFLERLVRLPSDIATTGGEAINESRDVFQERQKTLNQSGNLGLTNLLAGASAARAGANTVLGGVGDILNLASPLINPETGVTSVTEGLTRDLGTMVEKVPEEYRQQISDLITKYPKITATLGTAFDLSNLIPFLGALGKAKSAGQVDDIIKTVKARPATRFRGEVSPTAFEAGMNRNLISDVAQIPVKTTKATLKGTAKAGEFTGETAIATGVGISKPSQQAIKEAPELYRQARTGALTRETATEEVVSTLKKRLGELSDTGKEYNTIRQSTVTMPKQDFGKILDDFFKENDISKIDMPIKDRKVVQQAIDYIAEYDDILSAKNGLSLRRKLDDLADWSTEATGEGKRLIRKLRGKVDEYLGGKIPGLKELDAKYAPEVSFLKKVKSGILNADGSIKDSAISYVANIVGKGKEMKLDRLEELLPGIGQKVRALKAFEEVQAISSIKTGSIMRQLSGVALGNTVVPGFGAIAGFIATNPNIVAFALEKYGMAKKAIKELLKKGAKITSDEAVKVKQAVDAVPSKEVSTFLLGAGEQRKLLMPPKQGDNIIKQLGGGDTPTPSSSLPSRTSEASSIQKLLQEPQKPQKTPGKSSVLSQLSKGKEKSAGKKVNNSIIQKLKEKKNNIVEGLKKAKVDTELESLQKIQESMPGVPSIEVPKDYTPTGGLPTGTEVEAPIISSISKTKGKLPSPEIKRPQIRGFDLSTRSSMLESLKEQGMFTDSFFVVKDKNVSNKLFEYAEKKAIKKGNPTSGTKVDMKALVERAENGADTLLTPKEYMKLGKENGVYLRMDIGNGNQVAVNASYADIFFKNFDDVTFKGNNELSPVVVLSKGEPVGVIMPIKDVYNLKDKIGDFSMQSKTPQVEGKTDDYLYHGTSQFAFEKIQKEGIKPQGRGVSSLSKTEEYSRNWAFPEATGTKGVMLRVKKDFMEGKLFNTTKQRPKSDEMYELLTKETIPPEALEILKDGKWQPLVKPKPSLPPQKSEVKYSNPDLASEAKKYKSAEEFVKAQKFVEAPKLKWDTIPEEGIQAEIPLNKLRVSSEALDRATKNTMKGNGSRTAGDIDVVMLKDGTFAINEGHHRAVQKVLQKDKNIRARIYSSKDYFDSQVRDWENLDTTFSKEKALTKQQLTEIYNKAKPKPSPLSQKSEVKYSKPDLTSEARKYKSASEFEDAVKKKINKVFILNGRGLEDVSVIGSTARGKLKPNDLDILVTPKKKYGELKSEDLYDRIDLQNLIKDEIQSFFPDKKIHITISQHDLKRGPKISISDLFNKK